MYKVQLKLSQYTPQKDLDFLITQVDSNDWHNQNIREA